MAFETKNVRNVTLLGHSGSGKTTFAETMLFESNEIDRRGSVQDGNTVSDYTNIEKERGNSIFSTLMHANWKDSKINILDTPGFDDFVGEVISSMKVADSAIVLINSAHGVEVGTELIWEYVEKFETPAMFVINQVDHDKSDYDQALEQMQARFGPKVIPVQYPLNQGLGFNAIIDALRMVMYEFPADGGKPEKKDIPAAEMDRAKEMHNALVEAAAENDETLMEKYFDQGTLSEEELAEGLRTAIAHQQIFPVMVCSSTRNMGSGRIMGFVNDICPSPADRPAAPLEGGGELACNSKDGTCSVFIFKTISEPKVGMVSYFKVYSGVLHPSEDLYNANNRGSERFSQLFIANGKDRKQVEELRAGDIGVTVKLKIRWPDFTTPTRQITLAHPVDDIAPIYETALILFERIWPPNQPVRLLGVGVSGFEQQARQLTLWDVAEEMESEARKSEKEQRLEAALQNLRARFGDKAVLRASDVAQ